MLDTIQTANYILGLLGLVGISVVIFIIVDLKSKQFLSSLIRTWGLVLALIITISASTMTLVYSEFFGILPCGLCWLERVFLYPQVFLLGVALYFNNRDITLSGITLSTVGLIISLYHHYLQMGGMEFIKCPAVGAGISCTKRYIFEFGFITFPLLSAILFSFLIVLYIYIKKMTLQLYQIFH